MLKPFVGQCFSEAMFRAIDGGLISPKQIKRVVRFRGTWFITCELAP